MGYCFVIYRKCAIFRQSGLELRVPEPPRIEKFGETFFSFFPLQALEISQNGQRNPWKNLENPSDSLEIFGKSSRPACRPGRDSTFRIVGCGGATSSAPPHCFPTFKR
jgi:hypothetical protein